MTKNDSATRPWAGAIILDTWVLEEAGLPIRASTMVTRGARGPGYALDLMVIGHPRERAIIPACTHEELRALIPATLAAFAACRQHLLKSNR